MIIFSSLFIITGNVNGREEEEEEGVISPSCGGVAGESNNISEVMVVSVDTHVSYSASPPELMGPPHSPRATHFPLMFTPECFFLFRVPMVPLQRPDEIQIPSQSWIQTPVDYEETCSEQGIPTIFTWTYGGGQVAVEGSWDNWKTGITLQRSGNDYTKVKVLPLGVYQYRSFVDGHWKYAPDLPHAKDDAGNAYNALDLQEYVPEDLESRTAFEPPPSPASSYNNSQLGNEDYVKGPPGVHRQLQMTLFNLPSYMEILPPLARHQHVVLNHLYMQNRKSGFAVVALGSTSM